MSLHVSQMVWRSFPVGGTRKLIFLALADHANDLGENCYPSIPTLAGLACCSPAQARRHVHALVDEGFIDVVGNDLGGTGSRRYRINLGKLTPSMDDRGTPITDARGGAITHARGTPPMDAMEPLSPMHMTPPIAMEAEQSLTINEHTPLAKAKAIRPDDLDPGFVRFWAAYPRKEKKAAALKAWKQIQPSDELQEVMLGAIRSHRRTDQWQADEGRYIPHPASWLNGRRWEDEIDARPSHSHREVVL